MLKLFSNVNIWTLAGRILFAASCLFAQHTLAQSGPSNINISGGLFSSAGTPITAASVNFKIELFDKTGSCLLYSENHLGVDLSNTKGSFALEVGKGSSISNLIDTSNPTVMTSKVYENVGAIAGGWAGCASGATLANGDERLIRVHYDLGGGYTTMTPDVPMASAAYSMVAETLQGKRPSDFLQVKDDVPTDLSQANLENIFSSTNYTRLNALVSGSSTQYMVTNPAAAVGFNGQRITNVATPTATGDAATKGYSDGYIGGKVADTSTVGPATGNGHTLIWDQATQKWITGVPTATDNTKLPLAGGTMTGAIDMGGFNFTNTGHITMAPLKTLTFGTLNNAQETALIATLLPANAGATWYNSQTKILKIWDGTAAVDQVYSVNGKTGGAITLTANDLGLGTAALENIGTTAGDVPQLDAGGKIPAALLPASTLTWADVLNGATKYMNYKPNDVACANNEVLKYDLGNSRWICGTDNDTFSGSAAGGDLAGNYPNPTIASNAVSTPKLFANPGVNRLVATDGSSGATLAPFECTASQIMQWGGTGWACQNVSAVLGTGYIVDGGNTRGAAISIGTNDNFALNLRTNNVNRVSIDTSGNVGITGALSVGGALDMNSQDISEVGSNITAAAGLTIANTGANSLALSSNGTNATAINLAVAGVNGGITLAPNGTGIVTSSTPVRVTPTALPAAPVAGMIAFDSGASNAMKYHDGSAWISLGSGTGDFLRNGSLAMTGALNMGSQNITSVGTNITSSAALTIANTGANSLTLSSNGTNASAVNIAVAGVNGGITLAPNGTGIVTSSTPVRVTPTALPAAPAAGMIAFDSGAANAMKYYDGSAWVALGSGSGDFLRNGSLAMTGDFNAGGNRVLGNSTASANLELESTSNATKGHVLLQKNGGFVGIGTATPATRLDVNGAISLGDMAGTTAYKGNISYTSNGVQDGYLVFKGEGTAGQIAEFRDSADYVFTVGNTAGTSRFRYDLTVAGKLGIGTSTPARMLHVNGPMRITPAALPGTPAAGELAFDSGASNALKYHNGAAWVSVGSGTGDFMKDGSVAMTGALNMGSQNITSVGTNITSSAALTIANTGANSLSLSSSGTNATAINLTVAGVNGGITLAPNGTGIVTSATPVRVTPTALPGSPAAGTIAFDSGAANAMKYYDGSTWVALGSGSGDFLRNGSLAMTGAFNAGGNQILGNTTASANLDLESTSNATKGQILLQKNGGNVGIGTSTASQPLHLFRSQDAATNFLVENTNAGSSADATAQFKSNQGTFSVGINSMANSNGTAYLWNQGNSDMLFATNNVERMRVTSPNGYLGIGTNAPARLLHVNGPMRITPAALPGTPAAGELAFDSGASNALKFYDGSAWQTVGTGTGSGDFLRNGTLAMTGAFNAGGNQVLGNTTASANLDLESTSNATKGHILLQKNGGNVGIGTTTPNSLVQAVSNSNTDVAMRLSNSTSGTAAAIGIYFAGDGTTDRGWIGYNSTSNSSNAAYVGRMAVASTSNAPGISLISENSGDLRIYTGGSANERMRVTDTGNVGFGTTAPARLIDVNGSIRVRPSALPGTPLAGELAFDSGASNALKFYDGSAWQTVGTGTGSGDFLRNGSLAMTGAFNAGGNQILGNTTASANLDLESTSNATKGYVLLQKNGGNVGIGTTNPARLLHVNGPMRITPAALPGTPAAGELAFDSGASNALKYHNGSAWVSLTGGGTGDFMKDGSVTMTGSLNTGGFRVLGNSTASANLELESTSNATKGYVLLQKNGGRVGIGTTAPNANLMVAGNPTNFAVSVPGVPAAGVGNALVMLGKSSTLSSHSNGTYLAINAESAFSGSVVQIEKDGSELFTMWDNGAIRSGYGASMTLADTQFAAAGNGHSLGGNTKLVANFGSYWMEEGVMLGFDTTGGSRIGVISASQLGTDASQLALYTAATGGTHTERVRIDSTGKVGVGTTTPARLFHVNGPMRITPAALPSSPAAGELAFDSGASNALKYHNGSAWVSLTGGGTGDFMKDGSVTMTGSLNTGGFRVLGNSTASANLELESTSNATKGLVLLQKNGGGVAIGTTSASGALSVSGNADIFGIFSGGYTDSGGFTQGITTLNHAAAAANNGSSIYFGGHNAGVTMSTINAGWNAAASTNSYLTFTTRTSNSVTEKMRITSAGNVGIGTTSAPARLTVRAPTGAGSQLFRVESQTGGQALAVDQWGMTEMSRFSASSADGGGAWTGYLVANDDSDANGLYVRTDSNSTSNYGLQVTGNSGARNDLVVRADGLVGVGTNAPARLFHVNGPMRITPAALPSSPSAGELAFDSGASNALKYHNGSAWVSLTGGGSSQWTTNASDIHFNTGKVGIGTTTPAQKFEVQGTDVLARLQATDANPPFMEFADSGGPQAKIGLNTAHDLALRTWDEDIRIATQLDGTEERLTILHGSGYVGIGTNNPGALLHVNGPMRITPAALPGSPAAGAIAIDSGASNALKYYDGSAWQSVGGGGATTIDGLTDAKTDYSTNYNMALGQNAGNALTSGGSNVLMGQSAGAALTTGSHSTAVGYSALSSMATGTDNTAMGYYSMLFYGSGNSNTAVGSWSMTWGGTGDFNTAIGSGSMGQGPDGHRNTAVGAASGGDPSGSDNTAVGTNAHAAATTGTGNASLGANALNGNDTGNHNTAVGSWALDSTTASNNTALGHTAGQGVTTGANNTLIGFSVAKYTLETGSGNIVIGTNDTVDTPAAGTSNFLNIGNIIFATGMTGTVAAPAGSVGIGTNAPSAQLEVAGTTKLGSTGSAFTAMGTCTAASTAYTAGTPVNFTCTGVPASTAVAVNCSPSAALAGYVTARATGTANQIAITIGVSATHTMTCMWMRP